MKHSLMLVGHDQTVLYERQKVTPNDPTIQADFRALGDRLLDQDQQQKRVDLIRICVNIALHSPNDEPTTGGIQHQAKGTEVGRRTADLYRKQGNTDITELVVINEMSQCEACKEHNAKGKSFCTCGSIVPGMQAEKKNRFLSKKKITFAEDAESRRSAPMF